MVSMVCAHNDGIISDMPPHACWYVLASAWVCLLPFCALSHIFILTVFCKLNFSNLSARRSAAKIWIQRLRKLYTLVVKERIPVAPRRAPLAHRLYEMQSRQIEDVSDITPATVLWWRQAWESIKAQWPVLLTADTLLAIQAGTGFWKFQGCETRNAQGITRDQILEQTTLRCAKYVVNRLCTHLPSMFFCSLWVEVVFFNCHHSKTSYLWLACSCFNKCNISYSSCMKLYDAVAKSCIPNKLKGYCIFSLNVQHPHWPRNYSKV